MIQVFGLLETSSSTNLLGSVFYHVLLTYRLSHLPHQLASLDSRIATQSNFLRSLFPSLFPGCFTSTILCLSGFALLPCCCLGPWLLLQYALVLFCTNFNPRPSPLEQSLFKMKLDPVKWPNNPSLLSVCVGGKQCRYFNYINKQKRNRKMEAKIQVSYRYLKTPSSFKLLCHSQHYFTKVSPLNLTKLLQRDPIVPINSTHSALIFYSNYCVLYFVFCLGLYLIPDVCLIRYSSFLERSYLHFFPSL